jgi:formate hydrogenlyase subunit 3/multisubunit Na+/H+ antiporter MnhD subunit
MTIILIALAVILAGGAGALLARRLPKMASACGQSGAVLGSVLGLVGVVSALSSSSPVDTIRLPWSVPYGSFHVEVDALSAFFLLPVFLLTGLAAVYGARYLKESKNELRLGSHWAFFNVLSASMVMVVVARNAILFLVAWEMMALASYFLVTMDNERESVQRAGWTYLAATHLGSMALFFFFILMGSKAGSLDFDKFASAGAQIAPQASLFFVLAVIGFGTKAGIVPLHVWLPEAHPAAPSHVSAVMSGVMIKTGIYGLIRTLTWLGPPPVSWALALIIIGCVSGVLGVLLALAQHDLKRLLAYHSVENIGIIFLGLGIGVLGQAAGFPLLTILGYGGALLHTLNHAIFKGLLFLGAGSVQHGAHTLDMEHTGGLMRRMPWTGATFLTGAVAICGLPPLNGFISEFMIYSGAFRGVQALNSGGAVPAILTIVALALIGGLALACFTKAFGIVFLGVPRSAKAAEAHESKAAMLWPMAMLAGLCVLIGLSGPIVLVVLKPALLELSHLSAADLAGSFAQIEPPLMLIVGVSLLFGILIAALAWLRWSRLAGRSRKDMVTWDCGYAQPTAHMQYTASSFAQPLMQLAAGVVQLRERFRKPEGYFPTAGSFSTEAPDVIERGIWSPLFKAAEWLLLRFRWIQTGSIHLYILYIAITLIVLLIWKLR